MDSGWGGMDLPRRTGTTTAAAAVVGAAFAAWGLGPAATAADATGTVYLTKQWKETNKGGKWGPHWIDSNQGEGWSQNWCMNAYSYSFPSYVYKPYNHAHGTECVGPGVFTDKYSSLAGIGPHMVAQVWTKAPQYLWGWARWS